MISFKEYYNRARGVPTSAFSLADAVERYARRTT